MNELALLPAVLAGMALGGIFFGGLWWTVRSGATCRRPGLLFGGSALVRMAIVCAGLYLVGGEQWERLLACLVGIIAARVLITRFLRLPGESARATVAEADRAP